MERKFLFFLLILFFSPQISFALVRIPQDCSLFGVWNEENRTCTLTNSVFDEVEISQNNLTLDCAGFSIEGQGKGRGILLSSKSFVSIKNCEIKKFEIGIFLHQSSNNNLFSNSISQCQIGLSLDYYSRRNTLIDNLIKENTLYGLLISISANNVLSRNKIEKNSYNFQIVGPGTQLEQEIDESNLLDGKPIYFLKRVENQKFENLEMGAFICLNCKNITLKNLQLEKAGKAVFLYNTENSLIENVRVKESYHSIYLLNSHKNQIQNLEIFFSRESGIHLENSNNNTLTKNYLFSSSISLWNSKFNLINRNYFENLKTGDTLFLRESSNDNVISQNSILNGSVAISIFYSQNNLITENIIRENTTALYLSFSFQNKIFHNNFIKNRISLVARGSQDFLDNGYPTGGNYWSDYKGLDEKSGENQDKEGGDGIGDTPYCVENRCDRYPFIRANGWFLPKFLISEIYYDVAESKGKEGENEWIIVHNLENKDIDLSGWQICSKKDKEYCSELEGKVPANGFAILSPATSTFGFWRIPQEMIKIILHKKFGELNNDGDNLYLKDKDGNIVDQLSYGNDKTFFDPSAIDVNEGKSLLRYPPGKDTDRAEDFIESDPTIGKNFLPAPIITFFPKTPIKGIEVKFDASFSFDPDGEIIRFEWEIASTTFSGTTTTFIFLENGEYKITLFVTDNDGAISSTSTILKVEPFSFAIITDLHIGRYFREAYQGEDYYLTERLKKVVNWINQNKNKIKCQNEVCPLRFLVILGDLTENTSISGFCKTKEILDHLEIPYILVFGNHDVGTDEEFEQCSKWKGEDYFDQVFWSTSFIPCSNATSTRNFEELLKELNFQRDEKNKDYKNFAFSYGGINFIGLDFVSREKFIKIGPGVGSDAVLTLATENWLREKLEEFKENPIILLTHHPIKRDLINAFSKEEIEKIITLFDGNDIVFNFGGHIHSFQEPHGIFAPPNANLTHETTKKTQIFTTEALMVGSNGRGIEKITSENGVVGSKKGIIRIVKVFEKEIMEPNNWETTETGDEFLAFNPYFNFGFSLSQYLGKPCIELEGAGFCDKTIKPYTLFWDFGDGETKEEVQEYTKCYKNEGKYKITLTLKDKNSDFSESISRNIEIKEGIFPKTIKRTKEQIENGIRFFSEKSQMFFDKIGEIGGKIKTWILKEDSEPKPVGIINIDFDKLQRNLELDTLLLDTDIEKRKSLLYMPEWPNQVERSKILLLPRK